MTHYGLDGPGIVSRWRRDFPHSSRPPPPHPASYNGYPCLSRRLSGWGVALTIHPRLADFKERVSYTSITPLGLRGLF